MPLEVVLHIDVNGKPKFGAKLAWLFGLVSKELIPEKKRPEEEKRAVEGKQKRKDRKGNVRVIFQILRIKGLPERLSSLIRDILSRIKIRELRANLRLGLDSPADTGLLFAFIAPVNLLLSSSLPHQIRMRFSFADEAALEGYLYGAARVWPIHLVMPLTGFVFSLPAMRAGKTLVSTKWKREKR